MTKMQYKGFTYVEAKGPSLKTFHINVFGVDLLFDATSLGAASAKFRSILRPSKGLTPQNMKPRLVSPGQAKRLKQGLQPLEDGEEFSSSGEEVSKPAA